MEGERVVLCGANSYEAKYYFNEAFSAIPRSVRDELKIMCVLFTEDCGGILTLEFAPDGTLLLCTRADDYDYLYDEIEMGLQIRRIQEEKKELLESLELYYKAVFLKEERD